jgi:hypothetical protein
MHLEKFISDHIKSLEADKIRQKVFILFLLLLISCKEEQYTLVGERSGEGDSCQLSNQKLSDGDSTEVFRSPYVLTGETCVSEMRTCEDGQLSGSYSYLSCVVIEASLTDDCGGVDTISNFYWSTPPQVSGSSATGTINGINYTYTSSHSISTTSTVFGHSNFPTSYSIPNQLAIKNLDITTNVLSFAQPMNNPVFIFASIGQPSLEVGIEFSSPIQILWSKDIVKNSDTKITGNEGYVVVRMNGIFSSVSFDYLVAENWANFAFGADFYTYCSSGGM